MSDIGDFELSQLFNLNNLLYITVFVGSLSTAYWRLRKYLTNKNKEYMETIAEDVKNTIIQNLTNDNIVTEINFNEKINNDAKLIKEKLDKDAKIIKEELDKRFETVNTCNKRIEDKLNSHDNKLTQLDKKVDVHIARSEEQSKSLDRVINVVNNALGVVKPFVDNKITEDSSIKSD